MVDTDWKRYSGRWFEQARIPSWFEPPSARLVTADYVPQRDGSLRVINAYTDVFGARQRAVGRARIDTSRPGTLRVSFFPPFESDYLVLYHSASYDAAVVGTRNGTLLWFLTRRPNASAQQLRLMTEAVKRKGLAPLLSRLQLTPK